MSSVRWHFFVFRNSVEKLCVTKFFYGITGIQGNRQRILDSFRPPLMQVSAVSNLNLYKK